MDSTSRVSLLVRSFCAHVCGGGPTAVSAAVLGESLVCATPGHLSAAVPDTAGRRSRRIQVVHQDRCRLYELLDRLRGEGR